MLKINLFLFVVLVVLALALVTAQYQARVLKTELEQQLTTQEKLTTEYGQLQLEQRTWAMHSRVEQFARRKLKMEVPDIKRVQMIDLSEGG